MTSSMLAGTLKYLTGDCAWKSKLIHPDFKSSGVESKKRHEGELASPSKQRSDLRRSISLATEVSSLFYARDAPPQ